MLWFASNKSSFFLSVFGLKWDFFLIQLYNFGETVSVVFWTDDWQPDSYFDKILSNLERGLHTLCLLDIKIKEQSVENLMK